MLLTTRAFLFFLSLVASASITDTIASIIHELDVPKVVRNGTGPIDLSCSYEVRDEENGLVVKWYHGSEQIYQWIPPMPPQDIGIIAGLAEYPEENLKNPNSRSVIRLREVVLDMTGEYMCSISTFQEEASRTSKMIVYVPETELHVHTTIFNDTHLNVTCAEVGATPRPNLQFYVEGKAIKRGSDRVPFFHKSSNRNVKSHAFIRNTFEPMLIDCEISIPDTDYKRRERTVYYPTQSRPKSNAATPTYSAAILSSFTLYLLIDSSKSPL